ncbi:CAP domain-containing protein [Alkaliphilus transvaalensis]|uniref:CAP domain-containing protein n=1 Tax=Alkaliphilus transvaalensis TaxID=114628 RepID=UPI000686B720|nr:CAP domain-containing protein [Alkaliphilus transvaalensis]
MLNHKISKKVVVPTLVALMLMGTTATSSAFTVTNNSNLRFVYNINGTSSNGSTVNILKRIPFNFTTTTQRITINNKAQDKPAEESTPTPAPTPTPTPEPTPAPTPEPTPAPEPKPAPTPAPAPAPSVEKPSNTSNARHSLSANEIQMVQMVNEERTKAGLRTLEIDVDLSYVARVKSKDMSDNNYFSHQSPTYGSPFDMMRSFGISYRSAAENIARTQSLQSAHTGLMNSEGHRKNILNPNFTHIGIGIHNGYYTQMFISK